MHQVERTEAFEILRKNWLTELKSEIRTRSTILYIVVFQLRLSVLKCLRFEWQAQRAQKFEKKSTIHNSRVKIGGDHIEMRYCSAKLGNHWQNFSKRRHGRLTLHKVRPIWRLMTAVIDWRSDVESEQVLAKIAPECPKQLTLESVPTAGVPHTELVEVPLSEIQIKVPQLCSTVSRFNVICCELHLKVVHITVN